jgi:Spy/CpxP family protein refolding chaperone
MLHLPSILRTARRAVLAAAALLTLGAGHLSAAPGRYDAVKAFAAGEDTPGSGWPSVLLAGIDLSPQQKARLDSIRMAYAPRVTFDTHASGSNEVSWAARLQYRVQQRNAIRLVLTPQQRDVFDANAERARETLRARIPEAKQPPSRLQRILKMLRFGII